MRRWLVIMLGALLILTTMTPSQAAESGKRIIGYFAAWDVYGRSYFVTDIPADKITHINYAFAYLKDGECHVGDPWADTDNPALGGKGEGDGALHGNFRALKDLKKQHPNLKILISIGGWTWSGSFSDVAETQASREKVVKSCIDLFIKGNFPGVQAPNGEGVFDGIDIDWEYPVEGGLSSNHHSPNDKQNYTLLMQEFRKQLDELGKASGTHYLLSIAASASPHALRDNIEAVELAKVLDWITVMTYDFHGSWDKTTGHHANLFPEKDDPMGKDAPNGDQSVRTLLDLGIAPDKIVLGIPFYGHGWQGVPNTGNGLFQSVTGVPKGTWDDASSGNTGTYEYKDIRKRFEAADSGYQKFYSETAKAAWVYSAKDGIFISYDDAQTVSAKADYVQQNKLGGVSFWELSGDDGTLLNALAGKLK